MDPIRSINGVTRFVSKIVSADSSNLVAQCSWAAAETSDFLCKHSRDRVKHCHLWMYLQCFIIYIFCRGIGNCLVKDCASFTRLCECLQKNETHEKSRIRFIHGVHTYYYRPRGVYVHYFTQKRGIVNDEYSDATLCTSFIHKNTTKSRIHFLKMFEFFSTNVADIIWNAALLCIIISFKASEYADSGQMLLGFCQPTGGRIASWSRVLQSHNGGKRFFSENVCYIFRDVDADFAFSCL